MHTWIVFTTTVRLYVNEVDHLNDEEDERIWSCVRRSSEEIWQQAYEYGYVYEEE